MTEDEVTAELERCGFGPSERYQLYVVAGNRTRRLLATAADMEAIGTAIKTMGGEGELDAGALGILDRAAHTWIVNPFGERAPL